MATNSTPNLDGTNLRIAIIVSQFNEVVTSRLASGAKSALIKHGVQDKHIAVVWAPGSLELAQVAKRLARSGTWHGLIALGAVIRGETFHFELVALAAVHSIEKVALDDGIPITFGVLTTETLEQAMERAGGKLGNKGEDAAIAVIKMANLFLSLGSYAQPSTKTAPRRKESGI